MKARARGVDAEDRWSRDGYVLLNREGAIRQSRTLISVEDFSVPEKATEDRFFFFFKNQRSKSLYHIRMNQDE